MKIGLSADWHIDNMSRTYLVKNVSNRELDMDKQVWFMLKECIKRQVKYFIIAGDLFNKTTVNGYWFNRAIKYLRSFTDAGIHVVVIPGNHEVSESGVPLTNTLRELRNDMISVYNEVGSMFSSGASFFLIPHIRREAFKDYKSFTEFVKEKWLARVRSKHGTVVIGHFEPKGSLPGAEREMFAGTSRILDTMMFRNSVVFSGHIHTPQKVGNMFIVGSPIRFSLGECKETKRFIIYDTEKKKGETIDLDCQRMYKIHIDFVTKDKVEFSKEKMKKYRDVIVGISVESSKENRMKIVSRDIISAFEEAGAQVISYEVKTQKEDTSKTKKGDKLSMTPVSLFVRTTKKIVKSDDRVPGILKMGKVILEDLEGLDD